MPTFNNVEDLQRLSEKYLDFLVTDHGFKKTDFTISLEYHRALYPEAIHNPFAYYYITYHKAPVKIEIKLFIDTDYQPYVYYYSPEFPRGPETFESLEEENPVMKRLKRRQRIRVGRTLMGYQPKTTLDYLISPPTMANLYEKYTKYETEWMLKEIRAIIFRHPEILHGDVTAFPNYTRRPGGEILPGE